MRIGAGNQGPVCPLCPGQYLCQVHPSEPNACPEAPSTCSFLYSLALRAPQSSHLPPLYGLTLSAFRLLKQTSCLCLAVLWQLDWHFPRPLLRLCSHTLPPTEDNRPALFKNATHYQPCFSFPLIFPYKLSSTKISVIYFFYL